MTALDSGDVGRRVAHRRKELGMSRATLAARAGMSTEFVAYVETSPAELSTATMQRLAAALETTSGTLLGASVDRPPGRGHGTARPTLTELSPEVCWELIASGGVGRLAAATDEGPVVLPVNFVVDDRTIVFRTASDSSLAALPVGLDVGFEVDRIDDALREGWSVLVLGGIERVAPDDAATLRRTNDPDPWAGGSRPVLLRIRPRRVTGRRIYAR